MHPFPAPGAEATGEPFRPFDPHEDYTRYVDGRQRADGVRIGFTQIAGLVARRIMPFVTMGNELATGQRVGLIRFGSRVDVYLPTGTTPQVLLGQRTLAGETIVARIGTGGTIEGVGQ